MSEFLSALAGASVGGVFTLWGARLGAAKAFEFQLSQHQQDALRRSANFLRAIQAEAEVCVERFTLNEMAVIDVNGTGPVPAIHVAEQNYFSVFDGSVSLLGGVDDDEVQRSVLRFYTSAKGLLDILRLNSQVVKDAEVRVPPYGGVSTKAKVAEAIDADLSDMGDRVREAIKLALNCYERLNKSISAHLQMYELTDLAE